MTGVNKKGEGDLETLPETAKKYVYQVFCEQELGAREIISSNAMTKGNMVEEKNITLFYDATGLYLEKNEKNYRDEEIGLTGTPDAFYTNKNGRRVVVDFKSSYTKLTFLNSAEPPVKARSISAYGWQLIAYMILTDTDFAELCFGFVDTPESIITTEQRRLWYNLNMDDSGSDEKEFEKRMAQYQKMEEHIKQMHTVGSWNANQRLQRYSLELSDPDKFADAIQARIKAARVFYNQLLEKWKNNKAQYLGEFSV